MEKNMETNVKTTESVGTDGEVQCNESTKNNEKLFTQEEVNNIVKKRLYERKKQDQQNTEGDYSKKEKNIEERESSVTIRENRVTCREMVVENGYPKELLDILDTSDPEKFKDHAEKLSKLYRAESQNTNAPKVYPGVKPSNDHFYKSETTPFANTRHIPKQY